MIYDAFAHVPIYGLEALGFVAKGEAGAFIADGNTEPGGSLPLNTNGGGLSYTHTGMYGMFAITEGVRQLRGEAAAQIGERPAGGPRSASYWAMAACSPPPACWSSAASPGRERLRLDGRSPSRSNGFLELATAKGPG